MFDTEEVFKNIATVNNWKFVYGRKDYQNISSISNSMKNCTTEDDVILYCHQLSKDKVSGTVSLELILGRKSEFRESDYSERNKVIKEMEVLLDDKIVESLDCEYDIKRNIVYDKINEFDFNVDGVFSAMIIQYYE